MKSFAQSFYRYHELSKHTLEKLRASHYHLDWNNQPDPFRRYDGAENIQLPEPHFVSPLGYFSALATMSAGQGCAESLMTPPAQEGNLDFLSHLLFYSMAVSAWKQVVGTNHRWSLRVNPSSGDLHPTETHILASQASLIEAGAYHYLVPEHKLEKRCNEDVASYIWDQLGGSSKVPPFLICFTSIFWRESWKYRDRAYRYCHHDMGHALACLLLSSAALGWRAEVIGDFPDKELGETLGLSAGQERPALLVGLRPGLIADSHEVAKSGGRWPSTGFKLTGQPNKLSAEEIKYKSIDEAYRSTCLNVDQWRNKPSLPSMLDSMPEEPLEKRIKGTAAPLEADVSKVKALADTVSVHEIIRKRRSAVDMDGKLRISKEELLCFLVSATRGFNSDFQKPPGKDGMAGHYLIHLYLYVHRVDGVEAGVYYFDRLRSCLVPLVFGDEKTAAKYFSCFQDIAADGCFAVSMIADFNLASKLHGDRCYRYVHYEAGWIGQWLYLTATALGYDATGIGCFIDDLINQFLGLEPGYEVVYNFTVGRAVLDPRLTTLPSYPFPDPTL